MALGNLPYRYQITSRSTDANGALVLNVAVRDGVSQQIKANVTVLAGAQAPLSEVEAAVKNALESVMVADAGSYGAMLDAIIARSGVLF